LSIATVKERVIRLSSERLQKIKKGQIALTERQMKIMGRIIQNNRVSVGEVSKMFKITRQAALKEMTKLLKHGVVQLIGKGRGAYYELV
jgi:predicted HTH transcriptional regulator